MEETDTTLSKSAESLNESFCVCLFVFYVVASKIRYLQEYHNRVLHNIYPVPSGTDIANTLKYFSQTLLR